MNRHGSMNRIFRLVWNEALNAYVPAAETARGRGKSSKRKLIAAALSLSTGMAQAGPGGGQVTGGNGNITQSGSVTTIQQASQNLSLSWQTFSIAPKETVDFVQPNASAIAVNRILDPNGSVILGHLNANGQVYLINPNGVLFGKGAEVNVGGLVASTLELHDGTPGGSSETFSGTGAGRIVNEGTLTAVTGGAIALLGNHVSNTGVISAQLGTVAMGAGSAATLTFHGSRLVGLQVDQSVLNSVASNGGLIRADGGQVLMTAGAQKALLASVVNNTGVIEARTLEKHDGTITLLGGMTAGSVNVGGTLDASAPSGGNGGAIETSAAHVEVAPTAKVTTAAAMGLSGSWLIDPTDFAITAGAGTQTASGIGATTLQAALASGDVSIVTSNAGTQNGDINVNAPVSWTLNKLSLTAAGDINVNAVMSASGSASLDLAPGTSNVNMGFNPDGTFAGRVDFSGTGVLRMNVAGTLQTFTVINSLGVAADATTGNAQTLQGLARLGNLSGYFALGSNIDAGATSGWNPCSVCSSTLGAGHYGFKPIGNYFTPSGNHALNQFSGVFDGLGHVVSNLTINENNPALLSGTAPQAGYYIGLFGYGAVGSVVRNVGIANENIIGGENVGGLIGQMYGSVSNSYTTGAVSGKQAVGGLVGTFNYGSVQNAYSNATITGANGLTSFGVGGLIGYFWGGSIANSHAAGAVSGGSYVGGLVGGAYGSIANSYATGNVTASGYHSYSNGYTANVGGLAGYGNNATITGSHATGNVSGAAGTSGIGGLLGNNYGNTTIDQSYATGNVTGGTGSTLVGGLVGNSVSGSITNSYATGTVTGGNSVGGLVGSNAGTVGTSYATGNVSGANYVGGLVGSNTSTGTIGAKSFAFGAVSGGFNTGGLVGVNYGTVSVSYATGNVTSSGNDAGGLIGGNYGAVSNTFATGNVVMSSLTGDGGGGLAGSNTAAISNSYSTGNVTGHVRNGGFVGIEAPAAQPAPAATITNSYSTGTVIGTLQSGSFVGDNDSSNSNSIITNSFYSTTANPSRAGVAAGSTSGVTGISAGQLQSQANLTTATGANGNVNPGWDFGATWVMYEGHTNPLLQAFMTPLSVSGTIAETYTGAAFAPTVSNLTYSTTPDFNHLFGTVTVIGNAVGAVHSGNYTYTPGGLYSDQLGYIITYPTSTLTINPAPLTVVGTTANKVYDGTIAAVLSGATLAGLVGGDQVTLSESGTYSSLHAGTGIPVSVTASIGGAGAGDYTLVQPTGITGTITPAPLTVSGTTVGSKVYNGTTVAALSGGSLVGLIGGDTVTLTQAGSFASKNAGSGTAVTAADTLGGASAGDYSLVEPTGLSGTITPASLTVSGTTVGSKVYNGTTAAPLQGGTLVGLIGGDTVTLTQAGSFASKNAGTGIAVTANDSIGGASAGDYSLVEPTGLTGTISPALLTVSGTTVGSKVANGSSAASLTGGALAGIVSGDSVSLNQSGLFASASAGSGIAVTATDSLSGASAGDYSLVEPTGLTGSILPAAGSADSSAGPVGNSGLLFAAQNARTQIVENFIYPQLGANPQVINPATTIAPLARAADGAGEAASGSHQAIAVNVSMKIGANGTLKVENGGLRLPGNLVVGNE